MKVRQENVLIYIFLVLMTTRQAQPPMNSTGRFMPGTLRIIITQYFLDTFYVFTCSNLSYLGDDFQ